MVNRWCCQLFIRNSVLRWKGNDWNITMLFKCTNAWLVSLYFILEVSIMAAETFQNFWIYENIQKQMLEQIVLWIYITWKCQQGKCDTFYPAKLYFMLQNWDKTNNRKRFFLWFARKLCLNYKMLNGCWSTWKQQLQIMNFYDATGLHTFRENYVDNTFNEST